MSVFSDNQTKHFYALKSTNDYDVKALADQSDIIRVMFYKDSTAKTANDEAMATTDIIDRRLIKRAKVNEVKPTYYREWVVNPMTSATVGKTYSLYFYLENMYGFGLMDRWDVAATHTATSTDPATVMAALKKDLDGKLNPTYADTPIKNDFIVTVASNMTGKEATALLNVTPTVNSTSWTTGTDTESSTKGSGTVSGKKYTLVRHEGNNKVTYVYDNVPMDIDVSKASIIVAENPSSKTFKQLDVMALRMHDNPYVYDVTLSTYDGEAVWGNNAKRILPQNTANVYVSAAQKVQAMELYFLRNRADLYDLTSDFYTSILNETNTDLNATSYYTVDVDYAFSDTQGYTYHSDKQLSIAVPGAQSSPYDSTAKAIMNAIVGDTVNSLAATVNDTTIGNSALGTRVTALES